MARDGLFRRQSIQLLLLKESPISAGAQLQLLTGCSMSSVTKAMHLRQLFLLVLRQGGRRQHRQLDLGPGIRIGTGAGAKKPAK